MPSSRRSQPEWQQGRSRPSGGETRSWFSSEVTAFFGLACKAAYLVYKRIGGFADSVKRRIAHQWSSRSTSWPLECFPLCEPQHRRLGATVFIDQTIDSLTNRARCS